MSALIDHTMMPPTAAAEVTLLRSLAGLLASGKSVALTEVDTGASQPLPANVREVLVQTVAAMIDQRAVTIGETNTVLTTQEAADVLGVSRPTLVRLLEADEIAYTKPNRHRRILLADVLAYQQNLGRIRRSELDAMGQEAADEAGYQSVNGGS